MPKPDSGRAQLRTAANAAGLRYDPIRLEKHSTTEIFSTRSAENQKEIRMKVVMFNGSPRKNGNTRGLLDTVASVLNREGIETEIIQVGGKAIRGCTACGQCRELQNGKCVLPDDGVNEFISKAVEADGIILGSPVYFSNMTPEIKALIDRVGFVCKGNGNLLRRKVGASVVSVRRGGANSVFSSLNYFFLINEMIVPGSSYWNFAFGLAPGDYQQDEEGLATMNTLAENMAWLLKKTAD